ncbi:hypothetical protein FKM82_003239 [Ascaphus truei]
MLKFIVNLFLPCSKSKDRFRLIILSQGMFWSCRQSIFNEMKKKFPQIENAADEPRVLCIVQDTTNSKTIHERITLNLPASTSVRQLFEDVSSKVGYVNGTFDLKWGNGANSEDMTTLDPSRDSSLEDAGFEAGKKNFLHLTDKNGEQPQLKPDEPGTAESSCLDARTQEKFIGPLPREGPTGCASDYVSQNYSYSSLLNKSDTAWQQHDVQELCRVMFDALEQKWKQTEQADLINQLYQGKLKDYVRCLECGYESWRVDTFLDIPLVIRPYGSNTAFGSVEEALHAFIQPEILDGPNQYFCERCKKKCDARKGLRFLHFPYLLTLQLKRFDFDYTTMHRIKLNDRMTFPEELDMSPVNDIEEEKSPQTESCTDSGAENEGSCHSDQMSNDFSTDDAVDEGICLESNSNVEKMNKSVAEKNSLYELFSVMVHSGSAAGGHYYACIKSFGDDQWYSFNDQHVSRITHEDIKKTYGGSTGNRGYYSSAFASSTNAYMLMYRLKNQARNSKFLEASDFPEHIKHLVEKEMEQEEQEKRQREIERNTCKLKLFCMHPVKQTLLENKLEVHKDKTMKEAVAMAHKIMELEGVVPLDCCRLVKYDEFHDYLERSYEEEEDRPMGFLLGGVKSSYMFDLLLETKRLDQVFQSYKPGEVMVKMYVVDLKTETVVPPVSVRAYLSQTVMEFKQLISKTIDLPPDNMRIVLERCYNDLRLLNVPSKTLKAEGFFRSNKVFVESSDSMDHQLTFTDSHLWRLLDRHANTIRLYVSLPEHSPGHQTARTVCPKASGDFNHTEDFCETVEGNVKSVHAILEESTEKLKSLSLQQQQEGGNGDSSKSTEGSDFENIDSPLNEADSSGSADNRELENRILSTHPENNFQSEERSDSDVNNDRSTSSVDSDILSSSHSSDTLCNADNAPIPLANGLDSLSITSSRRSKANEGKKETWDTAEEDSGTDSEYDESGKSREETQYMYFKAESYAGEEGSGEGQKCLAVNVDKRITLSAFKQQLEPFVGASSSQFKVFRVYASNQEFESVRLNETLSSFSDDNKVFFSSQCTVLTIGEIRLKHLTYILTQGWLNCRLIEAPVLKRGYPSYLTSWRFLMTGVENHWPLNSSSQDPPTRSGFQHVPASAQVAESEAQSLTWAEAGIF